MIITEYLINHKEITQPRPFWEYRTRFPWLLLRGATAARCGRGSEAKHSCSLAVGSYSLHINKYTYIYIYTYIHYIYIFIYIYIIIYIYTYTYILYIHMYIYICLRSHIMYDYHWYNTDDFGLVFTCAAFFSQPKKSLQLWRVKSQNDWTGQAVDQKDLGLSENIVPKNPVVDIIFPIKVAIFRPTSVPRYAPSTKTCPGWQQLATWSGGRKLGFSENLGPQKQRNMNKLMVGGIYQQE